VLQISTKFAAFQFYGTNMLTFELRRFVRSYFGVTSIGIQRTSFWCKQWWWNIAISQ